MTSRPINSVSRCLRSFPALLGAAVILASCGGGNGDAGAANPESRDIDYDAELADAPPALERLYGQANELLEGALERFEA
jgi:hypothetical protein